MQLLLLQQLQYSKLSLLFLISYASIGAAIELTNMEVCILFAMVVCPSNVVYAIPSSLVVVAFSE